MRGGPLGFPFIHWVGPDSQVDQHPVCALHVGVCLMREETRSKISMVL